MIKTILVPVDGSEHANKAIGIASDLAKKYGARLIALHVMPEPASEGVPARCVPMSVLSTSG